MLCFVVRNSVPFHLLCAWILFENPRSCSHFGFSVSLRLCCCMYFLHFFLSTVGEIFSWGKSARGRLGRQDEESGIPKKVAITGEDPYDIVSLSCSHGNTLVAIRRTLPRTHATNSLSRYFFLCFPPVFLTPPT